jgi:hypothetical protein
VSATAEGTRYFRRLGRLSLRRYRRRGVIRRRIAAAAFAIAYVIATSTATTAVTTLSSWAVSVVLAVRLSVALMCGLSLLISSECGGLN